MTGVATLERPGAVRFGGVLRLSAGRLLRLEMRRNPMVWTIPLIAAMFWFDTYRSSMALPPLWGSRTLLLRAGEALVDFAPFVAGAAAMAGSRDGRRGTADQVAVTALPQWAARVAAWAATTCWALGAYLGCVGVLYGTTAAQAATGDPLWWPVAVSAAGVVACSALGFAAGAWFPSRFAAPLVAIVVLLTLVVTRQVTGTYVGISPMKSPASLGAPLPEDGVFRHYLPDLSLTQGLFLAGLTVMALGLLGCQAVCGGRLLRGAAATVTAAGLAVAATALALVGTARVTADGVVIHAVHDAADDRPISFTPVCGTSAIPICLNPAYKTYLPVLTEALTPILSEVAGLPGAPVRTTQVAFTDPYPHLSIATISGDPPVLRLALNFGYRGSIAASFRSGPPPRNLLNKTSAQVWSSVSLVREEAVPPVAVTIVNDVIGQADPARQAVSAALLMAAGVPPAALDSPLLHPGVPAPPAPGTATGTATAPQPGTPVHAAAQRFAALPASARHAWLAAHLAALRAGHVTLAELP